MKTTLIISIFCIVLINACNQNSQPSTTTVSSKENTVNDINLDTLKTESVENSKVKVNETSREKSKEEYFRLINATFETWTAGIESGGSGIEYYFKIKINTMDKIVFDSAWIKNKVFGIFISKETKTISNQPPKYSNGDIITLRVSDIHNKINEINIKSPEKHNGAALIGYFVNGKREYFSIKEIKKQDSPNRP